MIPCAFLRLGLGRAGPLALLCGSFCNWLPKAAFADGRAACGNGSGFGSRISGFLRFSDFGPRISRPPASLNAGSVPKPLSTRPPCAPKPPTSHRLGRSEPPTCDPHASIMRLSCVPQATPGRAKAEIRGPKSEGNPKTEGRATATVLNSRERAQKAQETALFCNLAPFATLGGNVCSWLPKAASAEGLAADWSDCRFGFRISGFLRISVFGLRISRPPAAFSLPSARLQSRPRSRPQAEADGRMMKAEPFEP